MKKAALVSPPCPNCLSPGQMEWPGVVWVAFLLFFLVFHHKIFLSGIIRLFARHKVSMAQAPFLLPRGRRLVGCSAT